MSCIDVSLTLLNDRLRPDVVAMPSAFTGARIDALALNKHLKISCGIICETGEYKYLNVTPKDTVWITDTEGAWFEVESNTSWIVEH